MGFFRNVRHGSPKTGYWEIVDKDSKSAWYIIGGMMMRKNNSRDFGEDDPHVLGMTAVSSSEEVLVNWAEIKKQEKEKGSIRKERNSWN